MGITLAELPVFKNKRHFRWPKIFIIFIAILYCSLSFAEDDHTHETFFETFFKDLASPVLTEASPWFYGGVIATISATLLEDQFSDPAQEEFIDHKPIGELSPWGDYAGQMIPNALYAVGMASHGWITGKRTSKARALLMTKATLYSGAVTTILKHTIREPRPGDPSDKTAFPSGHSATAFAFASVVGAEHEWYWGLAAYGLASLTALSRMNDNMHELHHVIGGLTIGLSYGIGLHYRNTMKRTVSKKEMNQIYYSMIPVGFNGGVFQILCVF
ncbi:MAG: phosphatase PAP2 family protein [Bdellovibrionales bacterium]|nr:phosphatase PAP2 family protein [Bdellovibrionales bacterium]